MAHILAALSNVRVRFFVALKLINTLIDIIPNSIIYMQYQMVLFKGMVFMEIGNQQAFRALADPSRRAILLHLAEQDMTIGEVADNFEMTRAAVKKHLKILEEGNLISVETRGRERINKLEPMALKPVSDWFNFFNQFWDKRLSALEKAVESHASRNNKPTKN